MVLCKVLGVVILLVAGGYVSMAVTRLERRRLRVLDGYISLLLYIKGQIGCYAMPVCDILASADPAMLAACRGETYQGIVQPVLPLPEMIRDSHVYLEPESERLLCAFSSELGHTFREEQVTRCEYYIEALGEERRRLAESVPARARMNSALSLCCAIGAAILLW